MTTDHIYMYNGQSNKDLLHFDPFKKPHTKELVKKLMETKRAPR